MPKIEDRKLTPRENYVRILRGEMPEWVPMYNMGMPMMGEPPTMTMIVPSCLNDPHPDGGLDCWGVNWVGNYETGNALLPEPNNFILDDITKWHDVIKAPDLSDVDWEMMCKKDLDKLATDYDRTQTAIGLNLYVGTFQQLVAFMGFTEGLIAMIEEPEETAALCKYMNDFYVEVGKKCLQYYKPDMLVLMDDTCSQNAPFMSEQLFRDILVPCYTKCTQELADPLDIPVQFHNCGKVNNFMDILHEEARVTAWDPAQTMNDLLAFKAKWGREYAIMGGFDPKGQLLDPDCPDEVVELAVKDCIDKYAPEGGYCFCGGFVGPLDDENNMRKNIAVSRALAKYGYCFYD